MRLFPSGLALLVATVPVAGQSIDRDSYYRHLPAMPRIVGQTDASVRMNLYGDRARATYRDVSPVDGIDDARGRHLLRIAARFAPILRRNNFSAPRHFQSVLDGTPVLYLDTWKAGRRIRSDSILMFEPAPSPAAAGDGHEVAAEFARADKLLRNLLESHHPYAKMSRVARAEREQEVIAFFDFQGEDAKSWRRAHGGAGDTGIYAHFFIHEDKGVTAPERYTFVIQYWFFYPFNDGINNHEGDWEHLAVLLTTQERAASPSAGLLSADDIADLLDEQEPLADSLVIREVEYYFHESVVTIDYRIEPASPRSRWQEFKHLHIWEQSDYIENVVQERRRALGGRLSTHPIGYIGGNNKGPDELTNLWPRFQGSFNRNGHGTFPFAGVWQHVGPLGATEKMSGHAVPRVRKGAEARADSLPLAALFDDPHFITFAAEQIILLPDWERVAYLVFDDVRARRAWSWLLLPIRWGYPATSSPGAGAIEHVDVGQVAPEGPAFQSTWNRLASEGGFRVFSPRVMRALFAPMTPWDRLSSGWGFLNIPKTLLGFVPGWSVVLAQLGPWLTVPLEAVGEAPPKTFAPERNPYRFSSIGAGWHSQFGGHAFARMLPQPADAALGTHGVASARADRGSMVRDEGSGLRAWMNLHYGPRFSVQNTFARSRSHIRYHLMASDSSTIGVVRGTLAIKEITGGFRYRLVTGFGDAVQLFAGAGWGWTWYDIDQVVFRGSPMEFERSGGYAVSILPSMRWRPNTWYGTIGVELLAPREGWLGDRLGYGLLVEYSGLVHRLDARPRDRLGSVAGVTRSEIALGTVVSW